MRTIEPLGGLGDPAWITDGEYTVRRQVLIDLAYGTRPGWGTYYPHLCPTCRQNQVLHAFDYVVRAVDGTKFVVCVVCNFEAELGKIELSPTNVGSSLDRNN